MTRRMVERTKDAKKKANTRATHFHPGDGQIRSMDRSLFAAKRHWFSRVQENSVLLVPERRKCTMNENYLMTMSLSHWVSQPQTVVQFATLIRFTSGLCLLTTAGSFQAIIQF